MRIEEIPVVTTLPLWKGRWGVEALKKRRRIIGESAYARGFQQKAVTDKDAIFAPLIDAMLVYADWETIVKPEWPRYAGVDLASEKRPGTVIFTIAVDPETRRKYAWPDGIAYGAWKPAQTVAEIEQSYTTHGHRQINVEDNGLQKILHGWIATTNGQSRHVVKSFTTTGAKNHLQYGVPGLAVEMSVNDEGETGWIILMGEKPHEFDCKCGACVWINELRAFPVGKTNDLIMASWFASEAARIPPVTMSWA